MWFVNLSLLPRQEIGGCECVFTAKHKVVGSIGKFKEGWWLRDSLETYIVDNQEAFAFIAKMNTIKIMLPFAGKLDWDLHQFDVNNIFLHGGVVEEVYIEILPAFDNEQSTGKVYRWKKVVYELKQLPRAWFESFTKQFFLVTNKAILIIATLQDTRANPLFSYFMLMT